MNLKTNQFSRVLILMLLTMSLLIFLAACGGSDAPEPEAASSSGAAETPTPADFTAEQPASPGDVEAAQKHIDTADQLFEAGKFDEAIAELDQAIEVDPTNADAYTLRGKSHTLVQNYQQASLDFTQAIELDPNQGEAYFGRAMSYTKTGSMSDLPAMMIDLGMVLQVSDNPELRQQAQQRLEQVLQASDDPALRKIIMAGLEFADGDLTRDFESDYLTLTYPLGWSPVDPSEQPFCQQHGVECLTALLYPTDGTNINIMRIPVQQETSAADFDEHAWTEFTANMPDATLQSRTETEIGGEIAVERVYSAPASSVPGGQAYFWQLYAIHNSVLFQFTIWAPGATALEQHASDIETIISSVQFIP